VARILIVDDDAALVEVLALAVADAGHEPLRARDGAEGMRLAKESELIISDVNMPNMDGFTLCKKLRAAGSRVPILMLTSRDTEIDEALGLELGADDYVTKPFSTRVLFARVAALLRREEMRGGASASAVKICAGKLELDADRLLAEWDGRAIDVTVTEFRLLEALARRPGVVQSRRVLLELARGDDSVVDARIVDTYVRRLRRKLEAIDSTFDSIETVIGAGYRWRAAGKS
jgi:DNA-binding response OmpR family regulator